jgi:phospholipid/cholesterol/gamma-HCH transport system substrate-binding protein
VNHRSRKNEIAVGVLLLAALAILAYMSVEIGAFRLASRSVRVSAVFDSVAGLTPGAVVSEAGVTVGKVSRLGIDHGKARAELVLDSSAGLRRNVALRIRARSMLGEKYVEVIPSPAEAALLEDGDVISHTEGQIEIDQMIDAMGPLLKGTDSEGMAKALNALSEALGQDPERADRILADTEALVHNLRVASDAAPELAVELRATLSDMRSLSAGVKPVLDRADGLLDQLETTSRTVNTAATDLPALMAETRQAVGETRSLVAKVDRSSGDLAAVLHNLREIDKVEVRRWLREEGVLIRLKEKKEIDVDGSLPSGESVSPSDPDQSDERP